MKNPNQDTVILDHLFKFTHITHLEALGVYGVYRLAGRIFNLRQAGWNIISERKKDAKGKVYAKYVLNKDYPRSNQVA